MGIVVSSEPGPPVERPLKCLSVSMTSRLSRASRQRGSILAPLIGGCSVLVWVVGTLRLCAGYCGAVVPGTDEPRHLKIHPWREGLPCQGRVEREGAALQSRLGEAATLRITRTRNVDKVTPPGTCISVFF